MKAVASMVTAGYTLCDVGTDHGYVPIALVQSNIIPKAIAVDINKGPLERANEHIRANGLTEQITTRLSNGLEAIHDGEVDSIVIAGMGGELVIHILTAGETVCRSAKELILQPQSEVSKVREYVRKVLTLRFGLEDGRARTLEEVGKEFNVTRERIRQIEAKALRKLRHPSRSRKLKDYLE